MPEENDEKPKEEKSETKKATDDDKIHRRNRCCLACGGVLFLIFLILGCSFIYRSFFGSSKNVDLSKLSPSTNQTTTPTTADTATPTETPATNYSPSQECQPVQAGPASLPDIAADGSGVKDNTQNHYFPIYGSTANEVSRQLRSCGPTSEGQQYGAITYYQLNWMWNLQPVAGGCKVQDVTVGINVEIYLPQWQQPENFENGLAEKWQNYITNLEGHENGHRQIGLDDATAVVNALSSLPVAANCDDANKIANDTALNIDAQYSPKNKEYDDATNHGETQGANFP